MKRSHWAIKSVTHMSGVKVWVIQLSKPLPNGQSQLDPPLGLKSYRTKAEAIAERNTLNRDNPARFRRSEFDGMKWSAYQINEALKSSCDASGAYRASGEAKIQYMLRALADQ